MSYVLVTPPTDEPISLTEAKEHLRVDDDFELEDPYIGSLITAAREYCEKRQWKAYITQTWRLHLDRFPRFFELHPTPVQSVTSVKYTPDGGTIQTVPSSDYVVDTSSVPARIVLERDSSWPTDVLVRANGVEVEFVAGYGDKDDVPLRIRQAMLLMIAHWYESREPIVTGTIISRVPWAAESLLKLDEALAFA